MSTDENTHTSPAADNGAITAFGTVCPATKFKFDAFGRVPHGNTVTKPAPDGPTT